MESGFKSEERDPLPERRGVGKRPCQRGRRPLFWDWRRPGLTRSQGGPVQAAVLGEPVSGRSAG